MSNWNELYPSTYLLVKKLMEIVPSSTPHPERYKIEHLGPPEVFQGLIRGPPKKNQKSKKRGGPQENNLCSHTIRIGFAARGDVEYAYHTK